MRYRFMLAVSIDMLRLRCFSARLKYERLWLTRYCVAGYHAFAIEGAGLAISRSLRSL